MEEDGRTAGELVIVSRAYRIEHDRDGRAFLMEGRDVLLTPREYRLVVVLAGNPNRVVTCTGLLEAAWDWTEDRATLNALRVGIKRANAGRLEPGPGAAASGAGEAAA